MLGEETPNDARVSKKLFRCDLPGPGSVIGKPYVGGYTAVFVAIGLKAPNRRHEENQLAVAQLDRAFLRGLDGCDATLHPIQNKNPPSQNPSSWRWPSCE